MLDCSEDNMQNLEKAIKVSTWIPEKLVFVAKTPNPLASPTADSPSSFQPGELGF